MSDLFKAIESSVKDGSSKTAVLIEFYFFILNLKSEVRSVRGLDGRGRDQARKWWRQQVVKYVLKWFVAAVSDSPVFIRSGSTMKKQISDTHRQSSRRSS